MLKKIIIVTCFSAFYVFWASCDRNTTLTNEKNINTEAEKPTAKTKPRYSWSGESYDLTNKADAEKYLINVLKDAYTGNLEVDWEPSKVLQSNNWFIAPFLEDDRDKRKLTTEERAACLDELLGEKECRPSSRKFMTRAVSFYNRTGNLYIDQIKHEMEKEKPNPTNFPANGFPEKSVAIKLLFTRATHTDVSYLENSVVWKIGNSEYRLIQIDLSVRDNASPTGWIFGSFAYHKDALPFFPFQTTNEVQRAFLRVAPLGLTVGNKPEETTILETPMPQHQGCNNRLNGPVDNPKSSCISCHSTAEVNSDFKVIKYMPTTCDENYWFGENVNPQTQTRKTFTINAVTLDYSLQLRKGIKNYIKKNSKKMDLNPNTETEFIITRDGVETVTPQ